MNWNAGGWFGAQIGATVWLLIAGILASTRDLTTGLLVIGLFALQNLLGTLLWIKRPLSCYGSTQLLVGGIGLLSLVAIYVLDRASLWPEVQSGGQVSAGSTYWLVLGIFGALMAFFYLGFGRESRG